MGLNWGAAGGRPCLSRIIDLALTFSGPCVPGRKVDRISKPELLLCFLQSGIENRTKAAKPS